MGLGRGPVRKPTALKVLEGNPGKQRLPQREPQPRVGEPAMPADLERAARAVWKATVAELAATPNLLTKADGSMLELYSQAVVRKRQIEAAISAELSAGKPMDRFKAVIARSQAQIILQCSDRLGLSPAARARLSLPESSSDDDAFLDAR